MEKETSERHVKAVRARWDATPKDQRQGLADHLNALTPEKLSERNRKAAQARWKIKPEAKS